MAIAVNDVVRCNDTPETVDLVIGVYEYAGAHVLWLRWFYGLGFKTVGVEHVTRVCTEAELLAAAVEIGAV